MGRIVRRRDRTWRFEARLRQYLKALIEPTWAYPQHLLHDKNATRLDAEIALQAVAHLVSCFTAALLRHRQQERRCGRCDAYAMAGGRCIRCGWEDPDYTLHPAPPRDEDAIAVALAEPCVPSSDISTLITLNDIE